MTEQEYAIMEAHRDVAEDALFDALPTHLDSRAIRRVFRLAYDSGYREAMRVKEKEKS